jgi:CBS domain-containing protein
MATSQTEVESQVVELATEAFRVFCDDIGGMFGVGMQCEQKEVRTETVAGLKKYFKKLVAVNVVQSEGSLSGTFQLIFDQEGLFTLGGVIVMLPEQRILANRRDPSPELAASMVDAVGEAGNFLVGSWDRVFREGLKGHGHFLQRLPAFVGKPWDEPEKKIGLANDGQFVYVQYEMVIGSYQPFTCGVIFPKTIFEGSSGSEPASEDAAPEQENPQDTQATQENIVSEESDVPQGIQSGRSEPEPPAAEEAHADGEAAVKEKTPELPDAIVAPVAKADAAPSEAHEEPAAGNVSEAIRKMTQSSAVLPGESTQPIISESVAHHASGGLLSMCAKDIMQGRVVWASPDETIQQALAKMQQHETGYIMVGADGVLEGIISRSDVTGALSPYLRSLFAKWRRPLDDATLKIKIKWIMSRPVRTIKPRTPLVTIMENVCRFGGRALPVVNKQGKVQGLVTVFDVFQMLLKTCADVSTVGRAPQSPPLT